MAASLTQLRQLADPLDPSMVEWRLGQAGEKNGRIWGKCLAYLTNRAIMDRLDEVVGPDNWQNVYATGPAGGVLCGIAILVERVDGNGVLIAPEWITKYDCADNTAVEPVKGGASGAMKRAAVQWSIGRYLYGLEEGWANVHEGGAFQGKTKEGRWFKWDAPALPAWALPGGSGKPEASGPRGAQQPEPVERHARPTPAPAAATPTQSGDEVVCPTCAGPVWDNRKTKKNPRQPDYKCRDKTCEGVIWPPREPKPKPAPVVGDDDHLRGDDEYPCDWDRDF